MKWLNNNDFDIKNVPPFLYHTPENVERNKIVHEDLWQLYTQRLESHYINHLRACFMDGDQFQDIYDYKDSMYIWYFRRYRHGLLEWVLPLVHEEMVTCQDLPKILHFQKKWFIVL